MGFSVWALEVWGSGSRAVVMPDFCGDVAVQALLGGSWVVISGVISRVTVIIIHKRRLIIPLITTHEPPST